LSLMGLAKRFGMFSKRGAQIEPPTILPKT
jgi:hypothetical protein